MAQAPKFDPDKLREALENRSRRPFAELLARIVESAPTAEAIQALAERSPDRWGQLYALAGRMAGYTEKLEAEVSISHKINEMSDAELHAQLEALRAQLDNQSSEQPTEPRVVTGDARLMGC